MRQSIRVSILLGAAALAAAAQGDPPGRVGRLNFIRGAVSFQPAGIDEWEQASPNRPLIAGDRLWTDEGSRAELHVGSTAIRLNSRTSFEFLNLDDGNVQIRMTEGSLNVRVRRLDESEAFEVDTPNLAFSILRAGEYRIDVNPGANETIVTARGGQGDVTGGGQPFIVHPREQARVWGADPVNYDIGGAPAPDEWDNWCNARDRREEQAESARYVSRDVVGYEDLDEYGSWRTDAEYGPVWIPHTVVAGWAPYRYGHWAWIEPWGWTWVDDAPWGFAPFHYGRWAYVGGVWGWVPGPVAVRPVYAPALVAWVGGPRFSISLSFGGGGGIGWFPLGPREVYVPGYRASQSYITRVNTTNTVINNVNVTNVYNNTTFANARYVNRTVPGAVTAAPETAFAGARRIQQAGATVQPQALEGAQVVNSAPVAPTREAVMGRAAASGTRAVQPPESVITRPVVARTAPPPPPVPFAQRQPALARDPGHPLDTGQLERLRANQPAAATPLVRPAPGGFGHGPVNRRVQGEAPAAGRNPVAPTTGFGVQEPARVNPPSRPPEPDPRLQPQPPPRQADEFQRQQRLEQQQRFEREQRTQQEKIQQDKIQREQQQQPRVFRDPEQRREAPARQVAPTRDVAPAREIPPAREIAPARPPEARPERQGGGPDGRREQKQEDKRDEKKDEKKK